MWGKSKRKKLLIKNHKHKKRAGAQDRGIDRFIKRNNEGNASYSFGDRGGGGGFGILGKNSEGSC